MFTGLIETVGRVHRVEKRDSAVRLSVSTNEDILRALQLGDSIAVDGVCLTVTRWNQATFEVDVSSETVMHTTIGAYEIGRVVNLERALQLGDRLGGHIVTGHIDGLATLMHHEAVGPTRRLTFQATPELMVLIVRKGSVTIDGISLTVNRCDAMSFDVVLVPHTQTHVTLTRKPLGSKVNIETDIIGKYVQRLMSNSEPIKNSTIGRKPVTLDFLKQTGFAK